MTRKFGNETVRLMFSIADVQNAPEEGFEAEATEEGEEPPSESYPIRCSFSITKVSALEPI
jgi:complement component 1 Q subcomponent-binding protein, mitochondrial